MNAFELIGSIVAGGLLFVIALALLRAVIEIIGDECLKREVKKSV